MLWALGAWAQELHQKAPSLSHFGCVWPVGATDRWVRGERGQGVSFPLPLHLAIKLMAAASPCNYNIWLQGKPPLGSGSSLALLTLCCPFRSQASEVSHCPLGGLGLHFCSLNTIDVCSIRCLSISVQLNYHSGILFSIRIQIYVVYSFLHKNNRKMNWLLFSHIYINIGKYTRNQSKCFRKWWGTEVRASLFTKQPVVVFWLLNREYTLPSLNTIKTRDTKWEKYTGLYGAIT